MLKPQMWKAFGMGIAATIGLLLISAAFTHSPSLQVLALLATVLLMPVLIVVTPIVSIASTHGSDVLVNVLLYAGMIIAGGILYGFLIYVSVFRWLPRKRISS